jgi:ubiquinone/menaquinone biosynthesis C-methylase UbiE
VSDAHAEPSPGAVHPPVPNHHAHHPAFSGISGLIAALSMVVGRRPIARLAAGLAQLGAGDDLVDVGCGPGAAAREGARLGATVVAVDPAPVMLAVARRLTRRSAAIDWVEGTAEALPVVDDSATVLWSLAAVHHWADVDAGLAEAGRVLRPGGRLVIIEREVRPGATGHASHGWTAPQADAFAQACRVAGFRDVEVSRDPAGRDVALSVRATR